MLTPGARLGPYEVIGSLGKGGMGEVHRAKDTRLGREVALKVLPDDMAANEERMARFQREARLLAALNHPHIAAIYGLEEAGSSRALVMEVAEGSTLLERLAQGPIPVDEALPIARQMAEALEYAHEKGIVHRDLKPANVKVTPDGEVKLLDFGLAKAYAGDAEEQERDYSESPTMSHQATKAGVILGTAAYMSPEQARGKTVDRRADIWSFGAVLLEMLTGRPTFTGESLTDVLAAVVASEPDLGALPPKTPAAVRRLLERCLDKDPKRRLRDIGEARVVLERPPADAPGPPAESAPRSPRRSGAVLVAAAVGLLGLVAGYLGGRAAAPEPAGGIAFRQMTFRRGTLYNARFAPDGRTVLFGAAWDGAPLDVFSVRADNREATSLGFPGSDVLSVSSLGDLALSMGRRYTIGFESTGTLARVPLGGSGPREILEHVEDADWAPNGGSLAVARHAGGLRRLEYPVGRVLFESGGWISHVRVSPDGERVAFLDHENRGDNNARLMVVDREGEAVVLAPLAQNGVSWGPSGDEVFYARPDFIAAIRLSGETRIVLQAPGDVALRDVGPDGRMLVTSSMWQREIFGRVPGEERERSLSWLDWSFPTYLSNDGTTLLFEEQNLVTDGNYGLFLRRMDGSPAVRIGDGRAWALSPDGEWVLTSRLSSGVRELLLLPTGAGQPRLIGPMSVVPSGADYLPDGERIVLAAHEPGAATRLYLQDLAGGVPRAISPEGVTAYFSRMVSPDGTRAFATAPDGAITLYPTGDGEPQAVPGTSLSDLPLGWEEGGSRLFVQRGTGRPTVVERVSVDTGEREPWLELTPPDPAGVTVIGPIRMSLDGGAYAYSYRRVLDELYMVEGIR
jgi:Tol biopolymer transport system component